MEHFKPILIPDEEAPPDTKDMDTNEKQVGVDLQHRAAGINTPQQAWQATPKRHGKATPTRSTNPQGIASERATSPERRAYSAQAEHNNIKNKFNANRFQPLVEEYIEAGDAATKSERAQSQMPQALEAAA
jgi:hypothetical protein